MQHMVSSLSMSGRGVRAVHIKLWNCVFDITAQLDLTTALFCYRSYSYCWSKFVTEAEQKFINKQVLSLVVVGK
jgi:hypothetical protein